jgi:hypothetical protein
MIRLAALLLILASTASAMVVLDSRVLSLSGMQELGVEVEVTEAPGPKSARKIWITTTVQPLSKDRKFRFLGFSILEKEIDADFASPEKAGLRDAKRWAKEVRGEVHEKPFLRFSVSEAEIPNGYIVVHYSLPKEAGIGDFGSYYLLLRDLKREAEPPPPPIR